MCLINKIEHIYLYLTLPFLYKPFTAEGKSAAESDAADIVSHKTWSSLEI